MKLKYNGGYSRYYPVTGLFVKPGEVHDLDSAPDADWSAVEADAKAVAEAVAPVVAPVAEAVAKDAPDVANAAETAAEDVLHKAEALLEANPELAAKLVEDVKNA
jgi:hypothetical protein